MISTIPFDFSLIQSVPVLELHVVALFMLSFRVYSLLSLSLLFILCCVPTGTRLVQFTNVQIIYIPYYIIQISSNFIHVKVICDTTINSLFQTAVNTMKITSLT